MDGANMVPVKRFCTKSSGKRFVEIIFENEATNILYFALLPSIASTECIVEKLQLKGKY